MRERGHQPLRLPTALPIEYIRVIGGQELYSGYPCIQYASSVTPTKVYNPASDTSYPAGLGYGDLWSNGDKVGKVLVAYYGSDVDDTGVFPGGTTWRVVSQGTLSYTDSAMPPVTTLMPVYFIARV